MSIPFYKFLLIGLCLLYIYGCGQRQEGQIKQNESVKAEDYKVTFIELGSDRCIPCKKMKPVMKAIETEFKGQVKVVFHDVWKASGKPYAKKYKIRLIPTQIFLDRNGKEYFRHEGFFPKQELIKILQQKGVR